MHPLKWPLTHRGTISEFDFSGKQVRFDGGCFDKGIVSVGIASSIRIPGISLRTWSNVNRVVISMTCQISDVHNGIAIEAYDTNMYQDFTSHLNFHF